MKYWTLTKFFPSLTACLLVVFISCAGIAAQELKIEESRAVGMSSPTSTLKFPLMTDPDIDIKVLDTLLIPLTEEDLSALSLEWRSIIKNHLIEMAEQRVIILTGKKRERNRAGQRWVELEDQRRKMFNRFNLVLNEWGSKGGDPQRIAKFRSYAISVIEETVGATDLMTILSGTLSWILDPEGGVSVAIKIAVFVGAIFGLLALARLARLYARRRVARYSGISNLLQSFLTGAAYWIVILIGILVLLRQFGISATTLLALVGGASFILGFALQDSLGNFASGLMIMVNRPFDRGDFVEIGGVAGTVKSVTAIATTITTLDNRIVVIPNRQVWNGIITNATANKVRGVELTFGVGYNEDLTRVFNVLRETVSAHPMALANPEPMIVVGNLQESSVEILCRAWVRTPDYWTFRCDLIKQVKERFHSANISIPYPQRDVHLYPAAHGAGA